VREEVLNRTERVLKRIQTATVVQRPVNLDDEVYYDLRIYGDDLYDLLSEISVEFGTDFSRLNINKYSPGEGTELWRPLLRLLGARPYKSLKVKDIVSAVEASSWFGES